MTIEYTHNTTDMLYNMEQMTNDDIQTTFDAIYDMYMRFDETDELNRVAEHFRTQIDMIENYTMKQRGISMFDKTKNEFVKQMEIFEIFNKNEIEKLSNDEHIIKWIEHLIQYGEYESSIETMLNDAGFVDGLQSQLTNPITYEQMFDGDFIK